MHHPVIATFFLAGALALAACGTRSDEAEVERALRDVSVVDDSSLEDIMLAVADPSEAAAYFRKAAQAEPGRIDLQRGLAQSLVRAGRPTQAVAAWRRVTAAPGARSEDRVALADALIRSGDWAGAETELETIPPGHETYRRYRLEAMVADSNQNWEAADGYYQTAVGLTPTPAGVLNNWGYSKLNRGDYAEAERLFTEALTHENALFTAKNNLVLARGAQRNYELPVVPMTQTERAQMLHTLALAAIKQGDVAIGRGLLRDAVDTHPQYFEAATRALEALEANVAG